METLVLGIQATYDLLFAGVLFYIYLDRKKLKEPLSDERIQTTLLELKEKYSLLVKQTETTHNDLKEALRKVYVVTDKLSQNALHTSPQSKTIEEEELSLLLGNTSSAQAAVIPSVLDIEKLSKKLVSESSLDLKSVLQSQLC
jgi:hypothetical protein